MTRAAIDYPFWLVFERPGRPVTLRLSGVGETLPVFSFAEEAELFLRLTAELDGPRIENVAAKELLSLVSDPRLDVRRIALDPPGENVALACLVSVGREAFLRFLRRKVDAAREENGPMCAD